MRVKQIIFNQFINQACCEMGIYKDDSIIVSIFAQQNKYVRIRSEFLYEG